MGPGQTPKQAQLERLQDWYPYYAGYSTRFVDAALSQWMPEAESVLDPWNGSGTTTAVAAARGLRFMGIDINPAVTVIARARLTPTSVADSLPSLADEILQASQRCEVLKLAPDLLSGWLRLPAVDSVRRLDRAIGVVLAGEPNLTSSFRADPARATSELPLLAAFFYAALFAAVRDLLQPFRASNPTWLRYPRSSRHRINPSQHRIGEAFRARVEFLASRLTLPGALGNQEKQVQTGSALDLGADTQFDACLTSPPYATRVDYVRNSLAELAVLGLSSEQVERLRSTTLGTPKVRGTKRDVEGLSSAKARRVVSLVSEHPSHGSTNYYAPWICNYFAALEDSLARISGVVVKGGPIALVVQDSFYKTVRVDLQDIVLEMMMDLGRDLHVREDHDVRHLFTRINPAAKKHLASRKNTESVLVFT